MRGGREEPWFTGGVGPTQNMRWRMGGGGDGWGGRGKWVGEGEEERGRGGVGGGGGERDGVGRRGNMVNLPGQGIKGVSGRSPQQWEKTNQPVAQSDTGGGSQLVVGRGGEEKR